VISFVWELGLPLPAGTGGSENYTIGHVRELNRRGIAAQIVTVAAGIDDGRDEFVDIPFRALRSVSDVSLLQGTVVFVTEFPAVQTRNPAYQFLHIPPPLRDGESRRVAAQTRGRTATAAGSDKPQGRIIHRLLEAHPGVRLVPAGKSPEAMAVLMASQDIVVMPSNGQYWHETFGIVSIEAQHAGCRVVASDDGGLPETNCGAVTYVDPDNAEALAIGIRTAIAEGQVSPVERRSASAKFTVSQSVDELLAVLEPSRTREPALIPIRTH
jgi:hypothetical protein